MEPIHYRVTPLFGCDPELFIEAPSGEVIGAEKAIPKEGIVLPPPTGPAWASNPHPHDPNAPKVVLDGVQIELHPRPDTCRARMSNEISVIFQKLKEQLEAKKLKASFNPVIEVSKEELESLSEESRKLGCAKSENAHDSTATINVNPDTYLTRSAGGHIHIGLTQYPELMKQRVELVWLLDAMLGNTCVMIDRDPHAAKRREVYGRAGEYRLPDYGLEYRTLSNFWLLNYKLMSMVFGIARLAVNIFDQSRIVLEDLEWAKTHDGKLKATRYNSSYGYYHMIAQAPEGTLIDHVGELKAKLDLEKVVRAINKNDLELAKENWAIVKDWLYPRLPHSHDSFAIAQGSMEDFQFFLDQIEKHGLKRWFKEDPMTHWCSKPDGHGSGFETFLRKTVRLSRQRSESMSKLAKTKKDLAAAQLTVPPNATYNELTDELEEGD